MPNQALVRYIIAMHAQNERPFIDFAQLHFSKVAENYLLSENVHPHVTLVQFHGSENDYLAAVKFLEKVVLRPQPSTLGMQFGYDAVDAQVLWAGLAIRRDSELLLLQTKLVEFLASRNIECLSQSGDLYAPHITLARIRTEKINAAAFKPETTFELVIGTGDEFGQLKKINKIFTTPVVRQRSFLGCCVY
jgi:2'-5' RNA ligase